MQMTFAIIKPDAVRARVAGQIIQRIEAEGFQIRAMRLVSLSKREAAATPATFRDVLLDMARHAASSKEAA